MKRWFTLVEVILWTGALGTTWHEGRELRALRRELGECTLSLQYKQASYADNSSYQQRALP